MKDKGRRSALSIGLVVGVLIGFGASELYGWHQQNRAAEAKLAAGSVSAARVSEFLEERRRKEAEKRRLEEERQAAAEAARKAEWDARVEATDAYVRQCLKRLQAERDNFEINTMTVQSCRKEFWTKEENERLAERYGNE